MTKLNLKTSKGDTLIEVLFAFAILGALIGLAFTGIISAHKTAVSALQRTQALETAQYQAEGLKMYRASLPWDDNQGTPSFLGTVLSSGSEQPFCMATTSGATTNWKVQSGDLSPCWSTSINKALNSLPAPPAGDKVEIKAKCIQGIAQTVLPSCANANAMQATITVSWTDTSGVQSSVKNVVVVTRSQ
ncbi:hypothetical protein HYX70_02485 [Candidatus Saccharibacteria bacterium]|nr:hypothetical protein [Candidatus Saccharibacteria bacterium]